MCAERGISFVILLTGIVIHVYCQQCKIVSTAKSINLWLLNVCAGICTYLDF